ncbi:Microcystin-dependent protein [Mariniphaga anaerophila]|uniref:Microcystin-dependent protein n=1 Tax=Mariniphaga anaerophila TaxID=1484053 RepID=A0A1M5ESZ9_9BACT|nr:tail fiber protein [Mariniphaga anaerophila]SHF82266.1 Microcystin-dependent protein [Mariniphaga anaerophila]
MSEPYVGEIRMFAGNFAPRGWAFCDGQLMAVSQNDALFSLLGTTYGGDGRTTFALPDLRGRIPVHAGDGPGLAPKRLGERGGAESVTLAVNHMPAHKHEIVCNDFVGNSLGDSESRAIAAGTNSRVFTDNAENLVPLNNGTIGNAGGNQSHANLMPYNCVHFIISLVGIYPSRH